MFVHCLYCCGQYQRALNLIKENDLHKVMIFLGKFFKATDILKNNFFLNYLKEKLVVPVFGC
jgi:hypothetical protein